MRKFYQFISILPLLIILVGYLVYSKEYEALIFFFGGLVTMTFFYKWMDYWIKKSYEDEHFNRDWSDDFY